MIIGLTIYALAAIALYVIGVYAKEQFTRDIVTIISFFLHGFAFLAMFIQSEMLSEAKKKQLNCPEYQKIENVYILKTKENEQP